MLVRLAIAVVVITPLACAGKRPPPKTGDDSAENQLVLAKLKGYTDCLDHSDTVFKMADRYLARFEAQPPTTQTAVLVYPSPDPKDCINSAASNQALPPPLPKLDAAGLAFARALDELHSLTTAAHDLFDREGKHYDPAKAVALHPKLVAAFRGFGATQGALFDEVRRLDLDVRKDQLARREAKGGRTFEIALDVMMLRAEEGMRFAVLPWDHLDRLDAATMTTHLDAFEDVLAELDTRTDSIEGFPRLANHARRFLVAARQLVDRARKRVAYSDAEKLQIASRDERSVVGTPAAMIQAYNELVGSYYAE